MDESGIRAAIEERVDAGIMMKYSVWTIGITDDPERRKAEHDNPKFWKHWRADSDAIARSVEEHFLDIGMKRAPRGGGIPNYVYIF